ncbi:RagB/SusD family nutrient uptake outer membrane protein [Halosquirtibacter laminarini]|uniref:RagB/SusD family nutrient uptake outer membrane protein n=1 Tax=Halosquirtibacter laminarini TaxID=3374600 RepID=A0AC61NN45_9BACT|nr:RagB/SusD family nutrient uptake outer membrane protein [Prolixibacteraceae bacterium]
MKRNIYITLVLLLGLLTACEKDLNIPSQVSVNAEANTTKSDIDAMVIGMYNKMLSPSRFEYLNHLYPEFLADDINGISIQFRQIKYTMDHSIPSDDILLNYMYYPVYETVARCNNIIKQKNATLAQRSSAYFCRALSFLRLNDLFAGVPYIKEDYVIDTPVAPSTNDEVLELIVEDLKYAAENAVDFDEKSRKESYSIVSKSAAKALLARVYRLQGNIVEAGKVAEEVISLDKFSLAKNPASNDSEIIMQFTGNKKDGSLVGYVFSKPSYGWNCFSASEELTKLIKGDDTRVNTFKSLELGEGENKKTYMVPNKYTEEQDSSIPVVRIAEMYLISAEAGNDNRLKEFQTIRKSSLSLENERRLELCFEAGIRWEDLKLAGKENYVLPYPDNAVDANPLLKRP